MGVTLTIIKVFIILFLLCQWEQGRSWQFSKEVSKLSFQLSLQIYYLLSQTEGKERSFLKGYKKGDHIVRLYQRALGCCKIWKSLSFCEIGNTTTSPLFLIRHPCKQPLQDMDFYNKLVDRFQELSKAKNPSVSNVKV